MKAGDFLKTADFLVAGDRAEAYGDCVEMHQAIADRWTVTLTQAGMKPEKSLDAHVVALLMSDMKVARILKGPYRSDSVVDACGYLALAGEIKSRQ